MLATIRYDIQYDAIEKQNVNGPRIVDGKDVNFWWFSVPDFTPSRFFGIRGSINRKGERKLMIFLRHFLILRNFSIIFRNLMQFLENLKKMWIYPDSYSFFSISSKSIGMRLLFLWPPSTKISLAAARWPLRSSHLGESGRYLKLLILFKLREHLFYPFFAIIRTFCRCLRFFLMILNRENGRITKRLVE